MTLYRLDQRALIRLSPTQEGEDVRAFLNALLTNDLNQACPIYAALLSPQGKTIAELIVWDDGPDILLECAHDAAEDLIKRLTLYRLRRQIAIRLDDALCVLWSLEPFACGAHNAAVDPRLDALGFRLVVSTSLAHSARPGDAAWQMHRLRLGVPEGQGELRDILWLETNAAELRGVSFTKGCYVGQENTARMNWRQKINRRVIIVPIASSREDRRRAIYKEAGFAADHLRIEDIDGRVTPEWLNLGSD